MAATNMGVFCIPKWALKPFKVQKELVAKQLGKQGLKRKHYLIIREADYQKKYIQDFIQNMEERFLAIN